VRFQQPPNKVKYWEIIADKLSAAGWPLIACIDAEENLLRAQFGDEYNACCSHAWRLIPGLYYQIRTGKVALFDGSWIASAVRKVGSGKYAKWLLFHLHQLQKFAQQNMH
jgi:hypothetical protein